MLSLHIKTPTSETSAETLHSSVLRLCTTNAGRGHVHFVPRLFGRSFPLLSRLDSLWNKNVSPADMIGGMEMHLRRAAAICSLLFGSVLLRCPSRFPLGYFPSPPECSTPVRAEIGVRGCAPERCHEQLKTALACLCECRKPLLGGPRLSVHSDLRTTDSRTSCIP